MDMPATRAIQALGQSIWYDGLHKDLLRSGSLLQMIADQGLSGLLSQPTTLEAAIVHTNDYDRALAAAQQRGVAGTQDLLYEVVMADIRAAADLFRPLHTTSEQRDGWVSLELAPDFAYDTDALVKAAQGLYQRIDRPNVMIKLPATRPALQALEYLIDRGINLHVGPVFSIAHYEAVADAYLLGLEARLRRGQNLGSVHCVVGFSLCEIEQLIDQALDPFIAHSDRQRAERARTLQGHIARAQAQRAYQRFKAIFSSQRFTELAQTGAQPQRLLWSGTTPWDTRYDSLHYVESLIGPDTLCLVSAATFTAFNQRGRVAATLERDMERADAVIAELEALAVPGLDSPLDATLRRLEGESVSALTSSYHHLLHCIETKTPRLSGTNG